MNTDRLNAISGANRSSDVFHPLCLNPSAHWKRLLRLHSAPDPAFRDRVRAISVVSPLMNPLCAAERRIYGKAVAQTAPARDPIFILGHWRSGTTLLHNALSKDPQFGFTTLFQSLAPSAFLVGRRLLQPLLALRAPNTRPMDSVKIRMQYPSEDEYALANRCPQSLYIGWSFPRDWDELFRKYAMMDGISPEDLDEWRTAYREIVAKATLNFLGRQIVLKNPVNTGRIDALLQIFPHAKFIHIYRNPYDVFRSTLHLYAEVLKVTTLQEVSHQRIQDHVLDFYPRLMNAYWAQREHIPQGNHAEIRYEDFVESPLSELDRVYSELGLAGWDAALPAMERFLASRTKFKPNEYRRHDRHTALVDEHWGFALDRLGYERAADHVARSIHV